MTTKPTRVPTIAMLAPVVPYRGGIAQHSSMLANALSGISVTRVYSYRRLYPEFLYPGSSTRDLDSTTPLEVPVEFIIDTLNPITWRRVIGTVAASSPTAVVIPWWTAVLGPLYLYLARALRLRGIPIVYLCHNVSDHEAAVWKGRLAKAVLESGDLFVLQSSVEQERLRQLIGDREIAMHPHPVYSQFPEPDRVLPRRADLELLCFGAIRQYKGIDVLLKALSRLEDISWHLTIVGEPWWKEGEHVVQLLNDLNLSQKVEVVFRYVSDREAANYLARADVVVLPYRAATGTGVVAAAYHYRKPIVGSRVGGLIDVAVEGKNALLVSPGDSQELADALRSFAIQGLPETEATLDRLLQRMTWEGLARCVVDKVTHLQGRGND